MLRGGFPFVNTKKYNYIMEIKKAAIFCNPSRSNCTRTGILLSNAAKERGIEVYFADYKAPLNGLQMQTDIIFSVGGDGTILKAARTAAAHNIKVFGINAGHLGFLSSAEESRLNFEELFDKIQNNTLLCQRRMMLEAAVIREGKKVFCAPALNEAAIKAVSARSIKLKAEYGGSSVKDYTADGILVATPTGSTAYNLAAGGPILSPDLEAFILTPICPHTLNQRPLVMPVSGKVKIKVLSPSNQSDVVLSMDGQITFRLKQGDEIMLAKYKNGVEILFPQDYDFFNILSIKLKWGSR